MSDLLKKLHMQQNLEEAKKKASPSEVEDYKYHHGPSRVNIDTFLKASKYYKDLVQHPIKHSLENEEDANVYENAKRQELKNKFKSPEGRDGNNKLNGDYSQDQYGELQDEYDRNSMPLEGYSPSPVDNKRFQALLEKLKVRGK